MTIFSQNLLAQFGKAIISQQRIYEQEDIYFRHDYFMKNDMLENPVTIIKYQNGIEIANTYNDGLSGHEIVINVANNLEILNAEYNEWHDMIDGSETNYEVEKIILSFNLNPFKDSVLVGFYTLQIKESYYAGEMLEKSGVNDTVTHKLFNGKFKIYTKEEINKGLDWVENQNELKLGIKDSLNIYRHVDEFASFSLGDSILHAIKSDIVKENQILDKSRHFTTLSFIVEADGHVNLDSIWIRDDGVISNEFLNEIKQLDILWNNWNPAVYKGKKVKSVVNLRIRLKK